MKLKKINNALIESFAIGSTILMLGVIGLMLVMSIIYIISPSEVLPLSLFKEYLITSLYNKIPWIGGFALVIALFTFVFNLFSTNTPNKT